ncbi:CC-adding tRNA nucleotidyltransferase [Fusobacterium sp. DD29]|uniref:CCA tRNA nucleotidyltransferase n=1 Tax=unclassified Fusobacterium TaxID=2648384 RepID=UPI001D31FAFB|nr:MULTISPECIES: HD domain-containing protein [unclassified Fusobacterium]MBR8701053.1 CC-adding tRNA nucleotidyltransferase [Fusobacterium sp. DD45]MBR8710859.1 CC-adding tRNA nucleotidyltransferase [Fusobacterium sp. DD28]MBR8749071.1 CC-adding tRNA nucleotidyltransferase [Fusobacterium sp. DD29]MBR8751465.1 CC-adding tRNA nucleotidyltransferase [Fusobacterium sp. DD26]MBR8761337.1 CC-adding tRNA nucleotidyltransferase [Fusobacterium sp. DD25]
MFEKIDLNDDIKKILRLLQSQGKGYVVGGYIRDKLLGYEPLDCDFVTDIDYIQLKEIFTEYNPIEIGRHFGVIQIKINNITYEIAKMREDIGIPENRKEQDILFTGDIYTDLKRRDFTVNAIAYDGEKYYYHDISEYDIANRNIRFIGDTERRIKEDPLRILRAFRFAATKNLNMKFDLSTIKDNLEFIKNISVERVREEFNKIIVATNMTPLRVMSSIGVIETFIPQWSEIKDLYQISRGRKMNVALHTIKAMGVVKEDFVLRLALFFHDIGKGRSKSIDENGNMHFYNHGLVSAEIAKKVMKSLKYDKKTIERVYRLVASHLFYRKEVDELFVKKKLNYLGEDIYRFYRLIEGDKIAHFPPYDFTTIDRMKILHFKIVQNNIPYRKSDLAINGKDLIEKFNLKGPIIGKIIDELYEHILIHPELNLKEELLNYTLKVLDKYVQSTDKSTVVNKNH